MIKSNKNFNYWAVSFFNFNWLILLTLLCVGCSNSNISEWNINEIYPHQISVNSDIEISFSNQLQTNILTADSIEMEPQLNGYWHFDEENNIATFEPFQQFDYDTKYKLTLFENKSNEEDNRYKRYSWSFRTKQKMQYSKAKEIFGDCLLNEDGKLFCSDKSKYPRNGNMVLEKQWKIVKSSNFGTCGIAIDESLWCWSNSFFESNTDAKIIGDEKWIDFSVFHSSICAIKVDSTFWCWSLVTISNEEYINESHIMLPNTPTQIGTDKSWSKVKIYEEFVGLIICAIDIKKILYCMNTRNQYENDRFSEIFLVPTSSNQNYGDSSTQWKDFTEGDGICSINENNYLYCNFKIQISDEGKYNSAFIGNSIFGTPYLNAGNWKAVAVRKQRDSFPTMCGIKLDSTFWCWGDNSNLQFGTDFPLYIEEPILLNSSIVATDVSIGESICYTNVEGNLFCWSDTYSSVSHNESLNFTILPGPKIIGNLEKPVNDVVLDSEFGFEGEDCVINVSNEIECFSGNFSKKLSKEFDAKSWKKLTSSLGGFCAIDDIDSLWCWGNNKFGQGAMASELDFIEFPTLASKQEKWKYISFNGNYQYCGIKLDDSLWCWGIKPYSNSTESKKIGTRNPQSMFANSKWKYFDSGSFVTCGIKMDETIWCWFNPNSDELNLDEYDRIQTWQVSPTDKWITIAVDDVGYNACGLKKDRSLWCWGFKYIDSGNTIQEKSTPILIDNSLDWKTIAFGFQYPCALKQNGSRWCWGKITESIAQNIIEYPTKKPIRMDMRYDWDELYSNRFNYAGITTTGDVYKWSSLIYGAHYKVFNLYEDPEVIYEVEKDTIQLRYPAISDNE